MALTRRSDDWLARARHLVEQAIRRRWAEGLLTRDPDGLFTASLGAEHVERLLRPSPPCPSLETARHRYEPGSPLGRILADLQLGPTEADLLGLLLACETEPACARLVAYLGGNQHTQPALTMELVFEIIHRSRAPGHGAATALLHRDLAPDGRLRRLRLIVVDGTEARQALAQGVRLAPRATHWLVGDQGLAAELRGFATLTPPALPEGRCDRELLDAAAAALGAGGRLLLIDGGQRAGRTSLLRFAAARLGRPLLVVNGRGLGPDRLVAAVREAVLHGAILALRDADEVLQGEGLLRFRESLEVFPQTIALIGARGRAQDLAALRPLTALDVQPPPVAARFGLWRYFLGDDVPGEDVRRAAALYRLGSGAIRDASRAALEQAGFARRPVTGAAIAGAVRQLLDADLAAVATRMDVSQSWADAVIPDELRESTASLVDRVRLRGEVMERWGFARKVGRGLGITALFSGEPGTGKSMVAGLIAADLGLDLYVINLSRVVSKWLGETEKNLERAFDAAEAGHVLLLFDEADTVLGKRTTDMRSANDRYANLETNFVLTRLERFQGVAIFTTNLASNIDAAVARRMSLHVHFPFPDAMARSELWRRMLPAEAPVAEDIDYTRLGRRYEVSGGFIRNMVIRAAFLAARAGSPITMGHLERAAALDYADRGLLAVGGRLK